MLQTVEAILDPSGQVHLLESIQIATPCRAILTVLEPSAPPEPKPPNGQELAKLLEQMATEGVAAAFGDPLEWQREQRKDRPLPGRDEP
jgi:hypothetical protein